MVRASLFPVLTCALALLAGACSGDHAAPAAADTAAESPTSDASASEPFTSPPGAGPSAAPRRTSAAPEEAPPPLAFNCQGGGRVAIGPLEATVQLGDGSRVQVRRDPDNAFHFRGEALEFRMRGTRGELSGPEGRRAACTAGGAP